MPREDIQEAVARNDYRRLRLADELYTQGLTHSLLKKCKEGQLQFAPTYKYDVGTNDFDTSNKSRSPAWADRVLFTQQMAAMEIERYETADVTFSDHKPVYSHFKVKVNKIDEEARALVEEKLIAKFN